MLLNRSVCCSFPKSDVDFTVLLVGQFACKMAWSCHGPSLVCNVDKRFKKKKKFSSIYVSTKDNSTKDNYFKPRLVVDYEKGIPYRRGCQH